MGPIVDKAFTNAYNECANLYDKHELGKCIEKAQEILEAPGAPRYHRMKTWILLGNCLGDWDGANDCYLKAESMWHIVRRWNRAGEDAETDAVLEEMRSELEALQTAFMEEMPVYDFDEKVIERMTALDTAVPEQVDIDCVVENETMEGTRGGERDQELNGMVEIAEPEATSVTSGMGSISRFFRCAGHGA